MSDSQVVIGIDPGLDGGIAILGPGKLLACFPMPVTGDKKRTLNRPAVLALFDYSSSMASQVHVFLEKGQAMPKQGGASMYNYGKHCGYLAGLAQGVGFPCEEIVPRVWQKVMLSSGTGDTKSRSVEKAMQLFPRVSLLPTPRCRVPSNGMSDALLIAEFGRRSLSQSHLRLPAAALT